MTLLNVATNTQWSPSWAINWRFNVNKQSPHCRSDNTVILNKPDMHFRWVLAVATTVGNKGGSTRDWSWPRWAINCRQGDKSWKIASSNAGVHLTISSSWSFLSPWLIWLKQLLNVIKSKFQASWQKQKYHKKTCFSVMERRRLQALFSLLSPL